MGQDDSCGLCGKHYQTCSHYSKVHILKGSNALCGVKSPSSLSRSLFITARGREVRGIEMKGIGEWYQDHMIDRGKWGDEFSLSGTVLNHLIVLLYLVAIPLAFYFKCKQ